MPEKTEKPGTPTADNGSTDEAKVGTEKTAKTPAVGDKSAAELTELRERLEAAEKTRDEYLKLAKSARADFENYQTRARRDQAEERRYAQMPLAHDLLAPLDNLERATAAARLAGETGALATGV